MRSRKRVVNFVMVKVNLDSPSVGMDATFLTQIYLILFHMKDEKL